MADRPAFVAAAQVQIGPAAIDVACELAALGGDAAVGATVTFTGTVRGQDADGQVQALTLEHYPGMTERAIAALIEDAVRRFEIRGARVVHRVGPLQPNEVIVFVAVTAVHRGQAFEACEFLMDGLKTHAPFWKKQETPSGSRWVEARAADEAAWQRWQTGADQLSESSPSSRVTPRTEGLA